MRSFVLRSCRDSIRPVVGIGKVSKQRLGPPTVSFFGRVQPTKIDYRPKKGTLILNALLEE